jgi:BirA family biotin operon repressor/biotin-[acetyl-CoA-carboxylase] ligase
MIQPAPETAAPMPRRIGHRIERHALIGSTNDRARELLERPDGDGVVVVADEQDGGRGRRGRTWLSPPGVNLLMSVALRPSLAAADAWRLGLATATAVAEACDTVAAVRLKWPNDVVAASDGRKVGGLLIETMAEGELLRGAALGIGLNVNWRRATMPADIAAGATSLADLAGAEVDREALLAAMLDALEARVAAVEAGASPLEAYRARCATLGTTVDVATPDGAVTGLAVDLDATGQLVLDTAAGRVALAGGEVVRVRTAAGP